jgi:mutual gliding-motility protein MglA
MATINYAFKEVTCKIVYYGPGLGGKTTNLIKIHETVPQKHRGELVSLATEKDRTLFFDFLPLDLGEIKGFKTKFQLYTVPGQVFYNATRKLVLRGVDGIVFVADSDPARMEENCESLKTMGVNLVEFGLDPKNTPYVLQYNKRDLPNAVPLEEMQARLNPSGATYFEAIAAQGIGVKETLKGISKMVLNKARNAARQKAEAPAPVSASRAPVAVAANPAPAARTAAMEEDTVRLRRGRNSVPPLAPSLAPARPTPPNGNGASVTVEASGDCETPPRNGDSNRFKMTVAPEPGVAGAGTGAGKGEALTSKQARAFLDSGIRQSCDLYWRRMRVGKAFIEFQARPSHGHHPVYDVNIEMSAMRVLRFRFRSDLRAIGGELRPCNGVEARFATFGSAVEGRNGDGNGSGAAGGGSKQDRNLFLWLKDSDSPSVYLRLYGRLFDVALTPEGRQML